MFRRIVVFGQGLVGNASSAFARFPVPALLILAFALLSNLEAGDVPTFDDTARVLAALSIAAAASLAAALGFEGRGVGGVPRLVASAAAASLVGGFVYVSSPFVYRVAGLSLATVLAIPLLPFIGRGRAASFWSFGLWTTVGLVVAFASAVVFLLGLYAVVEMIRTLFDTALFENADRYVLVTGLTLVAPLIALGRVPPIETPAEPIETDDRLIRAIRPLFDWVMAPLVWLAALVLHAYIVRTFWAGDLASDEAQWLLFVFCTLALLLRIGADTIAPTGATLTRWFYRVWFWLLIAPILALAISLREQVETSGLTPSIYYAGLWTVSLALIVLAQAPRVSRQDIRWMVAIPAVAFLLSCFGPWGLVASVTRSQIAGIEALGSSAWENADPQRRASLRARLVVLDDVGRLDAVRSALPPELAEKLSSQDGTISAGEAATLFGLNEAVPQVKPLHSFRTSYGQIVSVQGFDLAALDLRTGSATQTPSSASLELEPGGRSLVLRFEGQSDRIGAAGLVGHLGDVGPTAAEPVLWDTVTDGGRHVRIRVEQASFERDPDRLSYLAAAIFLRSSEWAGVLPR